MTDKSKINWPAVEKFIDEYANSYEMIGEDDEGREGTYNPSEGEIYMISDAIRGLLDDDEFLALLSSAPNQPPPAESDIDDIIDTHGNTHCDENGNMSEAQWRQFAIDIFSSFPDRPSAEAVRNAALEEAADEVFRLSGSHPITSRIRALKSQPAQPTPPQLKVWYGSMPESNGKTNWTAMLYRADGSFMDGFTIARSEYPDRVRYNADCVRHLIGELTEKPFILDYDGDKCDAPELPAQPSDSQTEFSDTEMLDWMLKNNGLVELRGCQYYCGYGPYGTVLNGALAESPREAIKAAMKAQEQP